MATMTEVPPAWTAEEFARIDLGKRPHELMQGVIVSLKGDSPAMSRARQAARRALERYGRRTGAGGLLPEGVAFVTRRRPDTARSADILFYADPPFPPEDAPGNWTPLVLDPPDLVVVLAPPEASTSTLMGRVAEYLQAGALMVWVLAAERRRLGIYRDDDPPLLLDESHQIEDMEELPGFQARVADLFDA